MTRDDDFRGDNAKLISCIDALLDLDDAKALVPNGLGGSGSHAYRLLVAARQRLAAFAQSPEQQGEVERHFLAGFSAAERALGFEGADEGDDARRIELAEYLASAPPDVQDGGGALADVAAERRRQIEAEGWTPEHDDRHRDKSMALAAACYAMFASVSDAERASTDMPGDLTTNSKPLRGWAAFLEIWPWERRWWKPKDRRSDLVRAGALIIAEIERLDRSVGNA